MKKTIQVALLLFAVIQFSACIGYTLQSAIIPYKTSYSKSDSPAKGWEQLVIYEELDPADKYEKIARIIITGNESASEAKLLKRMKKEAGRFSADAILFVETREVSRQSFDGISAAVMIFSVFSESAEDDYLDLDTGGEYYALETEGIAIRFIEE